MVQIAQALMLQKDLGKVLAGIQVPEDDYASFEKFLAQLGFDYVEETQNITFKRYLKGQDT